MTRTLVLTNHKGGVDKPTSATNIAFGLVQVLRSVGAPNPRVLLVDTDSQGHATLVTTGSKDYGTHDSHDLSFRQITSGDMRMLAYRSRLVKAKVLYIFYSCTASTFALCSQVSDNCECV